MVVKAQGGEFAFVPFTAAADASLIDGTMKAVMTTVVILSMALTPLAVGALKMGAAHRMRRRPTAPSAPTGSPAAC